MSRSIHRKLGWVVLILLFMFPLVPSVSVAVIQGDELSIEQFALSDDHVLILASNDKVYAWGKNNDGQLGMAATNHIPYPVIVPGLNHIVKVAASSSGAEGNSAAIDINGQVWTWGNNAASQLGRSVTTGQNHIPGKVLKSDGSPLSNIIDISLGNRHMIALDESGYVWGWGNNFNGQVGHGGEMNNNSNHRVNRAQQVIKDDDTSLNNIIKISAGQTHTIALDANGDVWVWGSNGLSALGTGDEGTNLNKAHRLEPENFGGYDILDIAAGDYHNLALVENEHGVKSVYGWGANNVRQLGINSFEEEIPILIEQPENLSFPENIVGISAGSDISVIYAEVSGEIKVYTAGYKNYKQLGHSEQESGFNQIHFYEVQGVSNPVDIQFSYYNGFLLQDGMLQGWGHNHVGQLAQGTAETISIGIAEAVTISNQFHTELSHLSLSDGQLFPTFHPEIQDYIVHLGSEIAHLEALEITTLFPEGSAAQAEYSGTNTDLLAGQSLSIPVADIMQGLTITVIAPNELSAREYRFHIERTPASLSLPVTNEHELLAVYPHAEQNIEYAAGTHAHDGGYLLAYTAAIDPPFLLYKPDFIHLVKTSASGVPEWSKIIGGQDKWYDISSIHATDDGGYVLTGDVLHSLDRYFFVIKINAAGDLEWEHHYDPYQQDYYASQMGQVIPLTTGQFMVIGYVNQYVEENWDYAAQIVLIHLDSFGQEQSRQYYTFDDDAYRFVVGDLVALPGGGFDMIATYQDWWGYETLLYMRLDAENDLVWMNRHSFEDAFDLSAAGIVYGDDDEGAIIGHTDEYGFVLPFSADGSFAEERIITYPELLIHRSLPLSAGDVLVAGTPLNDGEADGFVISTLNEVDWSISEDWTTYDLIYEAEGGNMMMEWLPDGNGTTFSLIGLMVDYMERTSPFLLVSHIEVPEEEDDDDDSTSPPPQGSFNITSAVSSIDGQSILVLFDTVIDDNFTIDLTKFGWIGFETIISDAAYGHDPEHRHAVWLTLSNPIPQHVEAVELQLDQGAVRNAQDDVNSLQTISVVTPYERDVLKHELMGHELGYETERFTFKFVLKAVILQWDMNRDGIFDRYDFRILLESMDRM